MSPTENQPGDAPIKPAEGPGEFTAVDHLQAEVRTLRILLNIVLLALLVLVVSLFSFIYRQRKIVRRQIDESSRYIAEYKRKVEPRLNDLSSKLVAYSKLHTN